MNIVKAKSILELLQESLQKQNEVKIAANKKTKEEISSYKFKKSKELYNDFTSQDIVLYFRDKSIEYGKRYVVSLVKDRGIIARLKNEYGFTSQELVDIIDFLFERCKYVQNPSINVLGSRWINSLSVDAKAWKSGEYKPKMTDEESVKFKNFESTGKHNLTIIE